MRKTPVDLYRMGNVASPRLEHIRAKDIQIYENEGEVWVAANTGAFQHLQFGGMAKTGGNWIKELKFLMRFGWLMIMVITGSGNLAIRCR